MNHSNKIGLWFYCEFYDTQLLNMVTFATFGILLPIIVNFILYIEAASDWHRIISSSSSNGSTVACLSHAGWSQGSVSVSKSIN